MEVGSIFIQHGPVSWKTVTPCPVWQTVSEWFSFLCGFSVSNLWKYVSGSILYVALNYWYGFVFNKSRSGDSYDCDKRLLRIFRTVCIEALCETQPYTIAESLKFFTERYCNISSIVTTMLSYNFVYTLSLAQCIPKTLTKTCH